GLDRDARSPQGARLRHGHARSRRRLPRQGQDRRVSEIPARRDHADRGVEEAGPVGGAGGAEDRHDGLQGRAPVDSRRRHRRGGSAPHLSARRSSRVRTLRTVRVTRYVTPLREGGSLPAIVEADDDGLYVLKFRGAGQGPRALIAELVAGEIARALQLPVPELVFAELEPDLARTEPDPEIFALIKASGGLNLALDYLPGAVMFDPLVNKPDPELASRIVWFDAFVTNVDRTARNPNLLVWHRRLWLI